VGERPMQDIGMAHREHHRLRHIDALSLRLQWLRSVHEALGLGNACLLSIKPGKFEKLDELEGFPVYNVRITRMRFSPREGPWLRTSSARNVVRHWGQRIGSAPNVERAVLMMTRSQVRTMHPRAHRNLSIQSRRLPL